MIEKLQKILGITEESRMKAICEDAREAVTLTDIDNVPYVCVDGTPVFKVSTEADAENFVIGINQVEKCLETLRGNYVKTHKDRRRT